MLFLYQINFNIRGDGSNLGFAIDGKINKKVADFNVWGTVVKPSCYTDSLWNGCGKDMILGGKLFLKRNMCIVYHASLVPGP